MNARILISVIFFSLFSSINFTTLCFAGIQTVSSNSDMTIQDSIDAAEEGDTVLVAPGTYMGGGNRDIDFRGKDIVLLSEEGSEHTIIDCEELGRGFFLASGESADAVISGFTVTRGYDYKGGCFYIANSSPLIYNCFIQAGNSHWGGAGIYLESSSSRVENCIISNCDSFGGAVLSNYGSNIFAKCCIRGNECDVRGAGMSFTGTQAIVADCIITENTIDSWDGDAQGGGIYSLGSDIIVEQCEISYNTCEGGWIAWVEGGGIYASRGTAIISDCLISGNSAESGGGIHFYDVDYPVVTGCEFSNNFASGDSGVGGGIRIWSSNYYTEISYCSFISNRADRGGGLHIEEDTLTDIKKCNFIANIANTNGGGIINFGTGVVLENSIIWQNEPHQVSIGMGNLEITWSDIEGGWPGEGNIDEDPLFVASEYGDLRLLWGSPCIDTGNPDSLDLDGTRSDMGAFSFDQSKELIVYLSPEINEIAPGETGSVKYTVCNSKPNEKNFGTAAGVRRPDGSPWSGNPLEDPFYTSITPSSNLVREFEYRVPLGWLPGTYSLAAGVGYRGRIFDLDHFEFNVVEDTTDIH